MPWAYQVAESAPGANGVLSVTIPDIAGNRPILNMKIDVEGYENALLRSNTDSPSAVRSAAIGANQ